MGGIALALSVAVRYQNTIFVIVVLMAAWYSAQPMYHPLLSRGWWPHTVQGILMEVRGVLGTLEAPKTKSELPCWTLPPPQPS